MEILSLDRQSRPDKAAKSVSNTLLRYSEATLLFDNQGSPFLVGMASKKRESKASSLDQSPAKRVKVDGASPTPTPKRNALRVTRKNTTFREWSSEDELPQLPAESAEPSAKTPNKALAKRNAPRSAKVNRKDPEWLVTNEKSPLAYEDLIVCPHLMVLVLC